MMKITGEAAKMNRAAEHQPKSGHKRPAAASGGSEVGNETKADMKGAQGGDASDGLRGAVNELKRQHPIRYDDLGPHHGKRMG